MLYSHRSAEQETHLAGPCGDSHEPDRQSGRKSAGEGVRGQITLRFISQGKRMLLLRATGTSEDCRAEALQNG